LYGGFFVVRVYGYKSETGKPFLHNYHGRKFVQAKDKRTGACAETAGIEPKNQQYFLDFYRKYEYLENNGGNA